MLIARLGVHEVTKRLPGADRGGSRAGRGRGGAGAVVCDPMHGNPVTTSGGIKTRSFDHILAELIASWEIHRSVGSRLGGVHLELTGEDVTECLGGRGGEQAGGLKEQDLARNYASPCDPRLNYEQSMELAFALAQRMNGGERSAEGKEGVGSRGPVPDRGERQGRSLRSLRTGALGGPDSSVRVALGDVV